MKKNKQHISFIVAVISVIFLSFVSCIKENITDGKDGDSFIGANISTYSKGDGQALGAAEYVIRRARLYAFDGDVLDNMVYVDNISNDLGVLNIRMKVKQTPNKTLYVILNEPDNAVMHSKLALINKPAAFAQIEYEIADYVSQAYNNVSVFDKDAFCLPMFGKLASVNTETPTPETDIPVSMDATRSLARVDVMIQKLWTVDPDVKFTTSTKLSIQNTRSRGYIAPESLAAGDLINQDNVISGPASALSAPVRVDDMSSAVRAFSFYTPERDCKAEADKLAFTLSGVDFGGVSMDFDVTIGNDTGNKLDKIVRNRVHKIYCTFTPKEVDVTLDILDWNDVDVPGDIYGSRLDVSASKMLMDWWNLGQKFDTIVTFDSDETVSFLGYYVNDVQINTLPTWLDVDMPTFTSTTTNGIIGLTYHITGGTNAAENDGLHPDVLIRLKSGNITKNIRVVYDNGFLPRDLLVSAPKQPWSTNVPETGIHLAKRGNYLPTADAASDEARMMWAAVDTHVPGAHEVIDNAMLHGKGYTNTSAIVDFLGDDGYAAMSCRNIGENWLLPSYYELRTVAFLKGYLGRSYNFEGISRYHFWSSTERNTTKEIIASSAIAVVIDLNHNGNYQAPTKNDPSNDLSTRAIIYLGALRTVTSPLDAASETNISLSGGVTNEPKNGVNVSHDLAGSHFGNDERCTHLNGSSSRVKF